MSLGHFYIVYADFASLGLIALPVIPKESQIFLKGAVQVSINSTAFFFIKINTDKNHKNTH